VIFCRLLFGNFAESLAYSKCACLNALYYHLLSRFSTSEYFRAKRPFSFVGIHYAALEKSKQSKLRSAKKGRPKSDLGRHISAFFKICFTSWSTINHAFTNHTKSEYNWTKLERCLQPENSKVEDKF
jgi:hypothetical protein